MNVIAPNPARINLAPINPTRINPTPINPTLAETARQLRLSALNHTRLNPTLPDDSHPHPEADAALHAEEAEFLRHARAHVAARAQAAPTAPAAFRDWFEALAETGPGQHDPLFPWLAETCTHEHMRWFLAQEIAGEAGFDDLVALTLPRMPARPKLELARNFWDEMGRGHPRAMHGPMLETLARHLALQHWEGEVVWQAQALANIMAGLATHRHYAYHAIGALGVVELTAPGRATQVAAGLKRLGIPARIAQYFVLHATLDIRHSAAWITEIIVPLVSTNPRIATAIAEGALMRLTAGAACFMRYREVLWDGGGKARPGGFAPRTPHWGLKAPNPH